MTLQTSLTPKTLMQMMVMMMILVLTILVIVYMNKLSEPSITTPICPLYILRQSLYCDLL